MVNESRSRWVERLRKLRPSPVAPWGGALRDLESTGGAGADAGIPLELSVATGWAGRLLVMGLFIVALFWVVSYFALVTVPVAVALLLVALLQPLVQGLQRARVSRLVAAAIALMFTMLLLGGVIALVGTQAVGEWPNLVSQTIGGINQGVDWLSTGPLHISTEQLQGYLALVQSWAQSQAAVLAQMAAGLGASVGTFLAGLITVLLATFFLLAGGRDMWTGISSWLVPERYAARIALAAERGWTSLVAYMQATLVVCFTTALAVAVSAWVLGVPMPVALFALTFVAAFIPIVGAMLAGLVAVAVALVAHGWWTALIMLIVVVIVNVVEANVVAPLLTSRAASLHPLAIMLGLTGGATLGGIVGALFAIPVLAFGAAFARAYKFPHGRPTAPGEDAAAHVATPGDPEPVTEPDA